MPQISVPACRIRTIIILVTTLATALLLTRILGRSAVRWIAGRTGDR